MGGPILAYVRRHHLGLIAIFIALTGTAYAATAKKNSVTSKSIKNGQVKLADLGPNSVNGSKVLDGSLTGSDIADGPGSGLDADTVDGLGSNAFAPAGSEAFHAVGAAGEPSFQKCAPLLSTYFSWENVTTPLAFFRDPSGVVHLEGSVQCGGIGSVSFPTVFTLPPGYRPHAFQNQLVIEGDANNFNVVTISDLTGDVAMADLTGNPVSKNTQVIVDGISFRCGPSGANGCP